MQNRGGDGVWCRKLSGPWRNCTNCPVYRSHWLTAHRNWIPIVPLVKSLFVRGGQGYWDYLDAYGRGMALNVNQEWQGGNANIALYRVFLPRLV